MVKMKLDTFEPTILIEEVKSNLRIIGWDNDEFRADADSEDSLIVEEIEEGQFSVRCNTACLIRMPFSSQLEIRKVSGDLAIKNIENPAIIKNVSGSIVIKNTGSLSIESISGSASLKRIDGDVEIGEIRGNTSLKDIEGAIIVKNGFSGIQVQGIADSMDVSTKGSVTLKLEPSSAGDFKANAQGSIYCKLAAGSSAEAVLESKSETINIRTGDIKEVINAKKHQIAVGDGEAKITLKCQGDITFIALDDFDEFDFDNSDFDFSGISNIADEITQQVTEQIESQIGNITAQIDSITSQIPKGLQHEHVQRKLERKQHELNRKLLRAQHKLDHSMARIERKRGKFAKSEPVSDEERLTILNMVAENKISIEDAEMLLASLEGREVSSPAPPAPPAAPEAPVAPEPVADDSKESPEEE